MYASVVDINNLEFIKKKLKTLFNIILTIFIPTHKKHT